MSIDVASIYSSQSSVNNLIDQFMMLEERPLNLLLDKKESLTEKKNIFSDLDSKLSSLKNSTDRLTDPLTDYFAIKKAVTSDMEKFTASAGASTEIGNHSITAERLAISDTRVTKQYTDIGTSFTGFTVDQIFNLEVAHPTDADPTNRVGISVTVSLATFAKTDDEVLLDVADAINSAMSNAVAAETLDGDEVIHASVVTEETGKSRLILRSERSGYTHRMVFTDSADSLLAALEVNSAAQSSGTSGGYITTVGTGASDSLLNTKFTIDGLTFYRDSNIITDAVSGVTLKLLDTFVTTETITVSSDLDTVKKEVTEFMDSYNDVLAFLRIQTRFNPNTEKSGALTNDLIYKDIVNKIRGYTISTVTGASSATYSKLFNIGIEADNEGKLSIKDADKFSEAVEAKSSNISELFNATDGVAVNIRDYIENFVKVGGMIDSSTNNIDTQVINLESRIKFTEELLDKREAQLKAEFTKLQEAMVKLTQQQSFFGVFS